MAVERKYERDIDLLLAEEFTVNPALAAWFRSKTKFANIAATIADVFVSKSTNLGESDLIALYGGPGEQRFALLIEDKVDAPIQPDQANRYRLRADKDVRDGLYTDYEVILCAPRFYLDNHPDLSGFDHKLSLEEIAAFLLEAEPGPRARYRAEFLTTAATKRVNAWKREADPATDSFGKAPFSLRPRISRFSK